MNDDSHVLLRRMENGDRVAMDTEDSALPQSGGFPSDHGYHSDMTSAGGSIPWTPLVSAEPVNSPASLTSELGSVGSVGGIPSLTGPGSHNSGDFTKQGCQVLYPARTLDSGVCSLATDRLAAVGEMDAGSQTFSHTEETDVSAATTSRKVMSLEDEVSSKMSYVTIASSMTSQSEALPGVGNLFSKRNTMKDDTITLFDQNEDGDSFLHLSIIYMIQNLFYNLIRLANAADLKVILGLHNDLHQTSLHLAVLTAQARIVRILSLLGSPLGARDRTGNTSLHLAARSGDLKCVKALTSPISDKDRTKIKTLLHQDCVPRLASEEADVYNYDGYTCLHLAAAQGHLQTVQYLLDHVGCDVNHGDGRSGRTILHHAVETENIAIINFLITNKDKYGLDLDAQSYEGHTPLKLAKSRGMATLTSHFILLGADATLILSEGEEDMWT